MQQIHWQNLTSTYGEENISQKTRSKTELSWPDQVQGHIHQATSLHTLQRRPSYSSIIKNNTAVSSVQHQVSSPSLCTEIIKKIHKILILER